MYCLEHGYTAIQHYDEDDGIFRYELQPLRFSAYVSRYKVGEDQARYRQRYLPFWTRLFASRFLYRYAVSRFWRAFLSLSTMEWAVCGAKMSLSQSVMCSMRYTPATLQRRYALLFNRKVNPANILLQSRLTAT